MFWRWWIAVLILLGLGAPLLSWNVPKQCTTFGTVVEFGCN